MKIKLLALSALFASLCASVQGQTLVDKTPVLHLSFDNVSGSTVINGGTGGSGMNGTLNGTAAIVSGGKFGNCLQVTGVNAWDASCRIANAVVPLNVAGGNTWTVAMWIKTTTPGGTWAYQGDGAWVANNTTFFMAVNNGNTSSQGTTAGGVRWGQGWEVGTAVVNDDIWHHIVFTFDGTTKRQYVDGVLDAFTTDGWAVGGDLGVGAQFWIGGSGTGEGDGQVCLNGLIDEAYVFKVALTQSDVTQLYNSNTVPGVPVAVTANPASGYRGQFVTVTATATPAAGTVTNATLDLSALGLSSAALMVQSSANVFTNSFTVPATAPIGAANLRATVIDTEPLVGSGGATFTVVALPPTNAIIVTQLTNTSVYEYTKASFHFAATNDAPNQAPFPMTYAWYKNSVLVSTNPMGPYYSFLTIPGDNGAHIYAIARVADPNFSSLAVTSAVVTLTVIPGTPVFTNGLKQEVFAGATRADVEIGNVGPGVVGVVTNADSAGGFGDNTSRRYSGYFIPPTNAAYVFFVASDDDCDVFLSTDSSPANKLLIAQEAGYSGRDNWQTPGGNGSVASQKRSDQWTNSVGATPFATGIPLVAGQKYYIESVEHNGGGGDNWAITYQTMAELALDSSLPADGSASRMTAASNNIAFATFPGTTIAWSLQPHSVTVYEGASTNFTSLAISDAEFTPLYQWYLNNAPVAGATASSFNLGTIPASYDGAQIKVVATTVIGGLSTTSSVVTLSVLQAVAETGFLRLERWNNQTTLTPLENGSLGVPDFSMAIPAFGASIDNPSGDNDFVRRISGYFIAPSNGNYVFYTTGDDDSDLFLSTDTTPANKRLVCQQAGWNNGAMWAWEQVGGGGANASQMRSSTWSPDGVTTPWAAGIPLVAGHKYYIEQDWHQGGGGANNAATFAMINDPDPASGTPTRLTGSAIAMSAVRCLSVAFTQEPTNVTVQPMGYATFSATGTTDSTTPIGTIYGFEEAQGTNYLFFQWYKNGVAIPGANSKSITLGPLVPSDNGAQIYCTMRALGYANDALTPIWSNSVTATITISPQAVFEPGLLKEDWWTNITSRLLVENGSVGNPHFTYTTPMFEGPSGIGNGNGPTIDYAQRISGFFVPPATDLYTFFTDSDDDSDFFISTDASPVNKRLVAQEAGWSGVRNWNSAGGGGSTVGQKRSDQWSPDGATVPYSSGISLNGGQLYYIEQVHHNGAAGGTHTTATFKRFNDSDPANGDQTLFVTNRIGMYVPRIQWVAFLQQPNSATAVSGGNSVTFTVAGTNDPVPLKIGTTDNPLTFINTAGSSPLQYQWYKNGTPIPGANSASYTLPYVLPSDQGAQFVCGLRALGYADNSLNRIYSNSVPAVLTVVTDTVPPTISYAATFQNTNQNPPEFIVDITFNKWMDISTLTNAARYSISGITNITVASNHRTVHLMLNAMPTLPLNVTVNGVKDLSGNSIVGTPSVAINAEKLTFSDIGTPGTDPAYPSFVWVDGKGGYIISAEGSDIWNANDGCNFGWELKTNDFDVVVRGVSETPTSEWAKEGLMVRETLDATSREWSIVNEPLAADGGANRVDTAVRDTTGGSSVGWQLTSGDLPPPSYPNAWLRLKRTGTVLDGFYSTNGLDWVHATAYNTATNATPLGSVVYVGICTTAHNNDVVSDPAPSPFLYYNTAEYANYSDFVPTPPAAHLSVSRSGTDVIVSWTPTGGHLESSPAISGAGVNWQPVGSGNPASIPLGTGSQFFRVVNP